MSHDQLCERLPNFYLCHCRLRDRLARGVVDLPMLIMNYPTCGGCSRETSHDGDSLICDHCHVTWADNAGDGDDAERFTDNYDGPEGTLAEHRAAWIARNERVAERMVNR